MQHKYLFNPKSRITIKCAISWGIITRGTGTFWGNCTIIFIKYQRRETYAISFPFILHSPAWNWQSDTTVIRLKGFLQASNTLLQYTVNITALTFELPLRSVFDELGSASISTRFCLSRMTVVFTNHKVVFPHDKCYYHLFPLSLWWT